MHRELITSDFAQYLPKLHLTGMSTSSSTDQDIQFPPDSPPTPLFTLAQPSWGYIRPWINDHSEHRRSVYLPSNPEDDSAV